MNEKTRALIEELLGAELKRMIKHEVEPHDVSSLKKCILLSELNQEIELLRTMLKDPDSFESQFKERCRWRMNNPAQTIPFSEEPGSESNSLYWVIANILFKPKTMQDMLAIILPDLKSYVKMDLIEIESDEIKTRTERMRNMEVSLEEVKLDKDFTNPPSQSDLCNYVISNDSLFDVHSISLLPLKLHASLQKTLVQQHPDLATKLYAHNEACQELTLDIQMFNNQGITPKEAIRQLTRGLTLGGSRLTGKTYAASCSEEAAKRFFEYFNGLPTETQVALREISCTFDSNTITLGSVLYNELGKGECVQLTANKLKQILDRNSNLLLLNLPSVMTPAHLKELENKYKSPNSLNSSKTSQPLFHLPSQLMIESIKKIAPRTHAELLSILFNFPPELYDTLWSNMNHDFIFRELTDLAKSINEGLFNNQEQREALAKVIAKTFLCYQHNYLAYGQDYRRHQRSDYELIIWALKTNDPIFLREAIASYPENTRVEKVNWIIQQYRYELPYWFKLDVSRIQALYEPIPPSQRLAAMNYSLIKIAASNPEQFKILIELLPIPNRVGVFKLKDEYYGQTILFKAAQDPVQLRILLDMLPIGQRLEAIKAATTEHRSLLNSIESPESLKILMEVYLAQLPDLAELPENKRLAHLKTLLEPNNPVLSAYFSNPDTGKPLVSIPKDKLKDSFVPDFIKIMNFLKKRAVHDRPYNALYANLFKLNSFEDIKKYLISYITKNMNSSLCLNLLKELEPERKPKKSFELLKKRCYRTTILSYLEEQIEGLPKLSALRNQLKVILSTIQGHEMCLKQLKLQVDQIKKAVDIHQDTRLWRFFNCNWSGHTANYNQLANLFDFNHDNDFKIDSPGLKF